MKKDFKKRDLIVRTINSQKGIIFSEPALVYRESYQGRDILAKNNEFRKEYTDSRGYLPVEKWILSLVSAKNPIIKSGEGLSKLLLLNNNKIYFKESLNFARKELFGDYSDKWPLLKILDIGGKFTKPSFSDLSEIPPIPLHVHSGEIVNGEVVGPGKLESYFFLPLDISPYNKKSEKIISRFGLKKNVNKEQFKESIRNFGKNDLIYTFLNEYEVKPYSGWTIPAGVLHSPGPWPTLEIQLPQDDFNLLAWRLGQTFDSEKTRKENYDSLVLRGMKNEDELVNKLIKWDLSQSSDFKEKFYRDIEILNQGNWGRNYMFNKFK